VGAKIGKRLRLRRRLRLREIGRLLGSNPEVSKGTLLLTV
jgi:hypothetical protein